MKRKEIYNILQLYSDTIINKEVNHQLLDEAIKNAEKSNYLSAKIRFMELKSAKYYIEDDLEDAFNILFDALIVAQQNNNKHDIGFIEGRIGAYYTSIGLFEQAFHYFMNSLNNSDDTITDVRGNIYNTIAITLYHRELFDEAKVYMDKALDLVKENFNTPQRLFLQYSSFADMYIRMNNIELAKHYSDLCKKAMPDPPYLNKFVHYFNDACILAMENQYEESKVVINEMYNTFFTGKIPVYFYDSIQAWSLLLHKLDRIEVAFDLLLRIYDRNAEFESESLIDIIWLLAVAYEKKLDYKNASKFYRLASANRRKLYKKNHQLISQNNIREIKLNEEYKKLTEYSTHDALTGCLNRTALEDSGQNILSDPIKAGKTMTVIMMDIDFFKQYNDNYGHLKGDECLSTVCETVLHTCLDHKRYLFRYGGDEFTIICELSNIPLTEICKRLLTAIRNANITHSHSSVANHVTVTLGAVTIDHDTILHEAIDIADVYLYKAKASGRDRAIADNVLLT